MTSELLSHSAPPTSGAVTANDPSTSGAVTTTAPSEVRLSLDPVLGRRGAVDGAWWPYSPDATVELPGLIAAVDELLGRHVLRVGLPLKAWDDIPHRVAAPGRQVKVGWFRHMDPHVVTLIPVNMEPVNLLVIPPGTESGTAANALRLAVTPEAATGPAGILAAASDAAPAVPVTPAVPDARNNGDDGDDGQASWEGEGGHR
ncbi:DUF5994 family protein [Streptosporangium sp. NPDC023825]|uniref:DUF5994 family protein n=1 Tax=Streptosporangium sp. NPDC023825 TaxID=3154909 RepID=UPI0034398DC6